MTERAKRPWASERPAMREFEEGLALVRDGRKTFAEFVAEAERRFGQLARYVEGRWKLPPWVDDEDVLQDLLAGAHEAIWRFQEGRSSLRGYVTFGAVDRAKKAAHRARLGRRPHRREDHEPSRFELGFGRVWGDDADRRSEEALAGPATQEEAAEAAERLAAVLAACVSEQERRVMRALAETRDLVAGVERLYGDPEARAACGMRDERQAAREVVAVVERVAGRMAAEHPEVGDALRDWGA